jgi:hypothetical protein
MLKLLFRHMFLYYISILEESKVVKFAVIKQTL